jgi:DNA-binding MarR family transcriptional regulator
MGYLEQERSTHDKRSVRIKLTEKALNVVDKIRTLEEYNADELAKQDIGDEDIESVCRSLRRLERTWADYINYGGR